MGNIEFSTFQHTVVIMSSDLFQNYIADIVHDVPTARIKNKQLHTYCNIKNTYIIFY